MKLKGGNMTRIFYDSGKRFSATGQVRIKGIPYVNEEKRKLKEERKLRKKERRLSK